ncbi:MAG TPA: sigma-70 family RNA polymerase sigma factor [Gammaproteobacteria bacterium]|jgi:RNA polymerase sigma-70 factor (ECF subfamily)|nr:sigma-70 family RNA polymerase sigma factor [Gammaproteobacteria bacterium]
MPASLELIESRNHRLADLLHAMAQGRQSAFQELYDQVSPQLFAILLRILRRRDLAEEALQDALLSVWRNAGSYSAEKGAPMTWLVSICRYRALDTLRRQRREVSLEPMLEGIEDGSTEVAGLVAESTDTGLISKAEERALEDCMQRLNDGQRSSIKLAYFDGCTHEEIAVNLGSPIGTVKSWVRRGLESLKRCLEAA